MHNLLLILYLVAAYVCVKSWYDLVNLAHKYRDCDMDCPTLWLSVLTIFFAYLSLAPMLIAWATHGFNLGDTAFGLRLCKTAIICLVVSTLGCYLNISHIRDEAAYQH